MRLESTTLEGPSLRLTPVSMADLPDYAETALSAPEIWQHIPYRMQTQADLEAALQRAVVAQASGKACTFATRLGHSGEIIGGTRITLVDETFPSVEIGGTWIVPRWQRTHVNSEAKLLQLTHVFETLGCLRCELRTDVRNWRSRAAIAHIGGVEEGVLRAHMRRVDGSLRDSVLFSILASEWPRVKLALQEKLKPPMAAST